MVITGIQHGSILVVLIPHTQPESHHRFFNRCSGAQANNGTVTAATQYRGLQVGTVDGWLGRGQSTRLVARYHHCGGKRLVQARLNLQATQSGMGANRGCQTQ